MSAISGSAGFGSSVAPVSNPAAFAAAEQVLGMSSGSLRIALQSGQRLVDIAATKGLDRATFITEIANAINKNRPDLGSVMANAMANRAVGRPVMAAPEIQEPSTEAPVAAQPAITEMPKTAKAQEGEPTEIDAAEGAETSEDETAGRASAQPAGNLLDHLSTMFNMSKGDLVSSWRRGATPIQIAVSRGVEPSDLLTAVETLLKSSGSASVSSRADELARSLVVAPLTQGSLVTASA